jgi:hypothetical protein
LREMLQDYAADRGMVRAASAAGAQGEDSSPGEDEQ